MHLCFLIFSTPLTTTTTHQITTTTTITIIIIIIKQTGLSNLRTQEDAGDWYCSAVDFQDVPTDRDGMINMFINID